MILSVPGCPNVPLLEQRLAQALAGRPAVTVRRVIAGADEAARCGMRGSPTLLVNGHDPFAVPGRGPALACRIYEGEGGRLEGAPTVDALRRALEQAGTRFVPAGARSREQSPNSRPASGTGLPSSLPSGSTARIRGDRPR
jgi:hypothetical protein